jgi:hypothetical protein
MTQAARQLFNPDLALHSRQTLPKGRVSQPKAAGSQGMVEV